MALAVYLLAVFGGFGLLALALKQRMRSLESSHWPTAQAVILVSGVAQHPGSNGGRPSYQTRVQYDYVVDGRTYHGSCISHGLTPDLSGSHPASQALRYAPGNVAQVRHHPTDPGQAVLETHARGAGLAAATFGVLLIGAAGVATALDVLASS